MTRTLPLVVAALLLLVGGWFAWDSFQGPEEQATDAEKGGQMPADRSVVPTSKLAEADVRAGKPTPAAEATSREKLTTAQSQRTEDIPADQAVRVRVVQDATNQPVPGVRVFPTPGHIASPPAAVTGSYENARLRRVRPCAATDKTPSEQNRAS